RLSLPSFPTRRSSDLDERQLRAGLLIVSRLHLLERHPQLSPQGVRNALGQLLGVHVVQRRTTGRQVVQRSGDCFREQQVVQAARSEEHTSELQSREKL